jgi:hypothetical protein
MNNPPEIELPRLEKSQRVVEEQNQFQALQKEILAAVKNAPKPPAKVISKEPLPQEMVTALTQWAYRYAYVLHYKEKRKLVEEDPHALRREYIWVTVYTIELYWVNSPINLK